MQATNHNSDLEPGATTFAGKLAVVTGGGSGMGRALVRQLAAEGCSVAACDWYAVPVADAATAAQADALEGALVTAHTCDVSDEEQVGRFRDELLHQHATDHVDLVFSNAGIGGGASFVKGGREEWDRTFAVNWWGVYNCARTFLPLLIASGDGVIVNTSSVNGFWAALGPGMPNSAYATAKFAIRGFTESLIEDLRSNAPEVRAVLVMPGHVGTDILANTRRAHGRAEPRDMSDAVIQETIPADAREGLIRAGLLRKGASTDDLRRLLEQFETDFRDKAPVTAEAAATTILDGVRTGKWRILIGRDAATLDSVIRAHPEAAYDYNELFKLAKEEAERTASAV